jgi:hypothetical protein
VKQTLPLEAEPFWAEEGIEAYRVLTPTLIFEPQATIDLTDSEARPLLGEGWDGAPEENGWWAVDDAEGSVVFVPLAEVDANTPYTLTADMTFVSFPSATNQNAMLVVNGVPIGAIAAETAGQPQQATWQVPAGVLHDGLNRLELRWSFAGSPRAELDGDRSIGTTGVQLPIDADLKAFADGGFMALFDEEGVQSDASAGRKGINVTTLDVRTGDVINQLGFDTTANEFEAEALASAIEDLPEGAITLVVSNGDAGAHLTQEAVDALRSLGIDVTLEQMAGNYLAAVGVKGSAPGSAARSIDPNEAFLRISLTRDRRQLAAQVRSIDLAPRE